MVLVLLRHLMTFQRLDLAYVSYASHKQQQQQQRTHLASCTSVSINQQSVYQNKYKGVWCTSVSISGPSAPTYSLSLRLFQ